MAWAAAWFLLGGLASAALILQSAPEPRDGLGRSRRWVAHLLALAVAAATLLVWALDAGSLGLLASPLAAVAAVSMGTAAALLLFRLVPRVDETHVLVVTVLAWTLLVAHWRGLGALAYVLAALAAAPTLLAARLAATRRRPGPREKLALHAWTLGATSVAAVSLAWLADVLAVEAGAPVAPGRAFAAGAVAVHAVTPLAIVYRALRGDHDERRALREAFLDRQLPPALALPLVAAIALAVLANERAGLLDRSLLLAILLALSPLVARALDRSPPSREIEVGPEAS